MRVLSTEAVILHSLPFGESDSIVTLFAREAGLLTVIGKGARRSRKRFGGILGSLVRIQSEIHFRKANTMPLLNSASLIDFGMGLRRDLARIAQAFYAAELIRRGVKPGVRMQNLYDAFTAILTGLAGEGSRPEGLMGFLLRYQEVQGYKPKLESCAVCQGEGRRAKGEGGGDVGISYKAGGIVCAKCENRAEINMRLPLAALELLVHLSESDTDPSNVERPIRTPVLPRHFLRRGGRRTSNVNKSFASPAAEAAAAIQFLHRFIQYHLEFQPASWRWWRRMIEKE